MSVLPERKQQIMQTHAGLINQVVQTCANPERKNELLQALKMAENNGWVALAKCIRQILGGKRDASLLNELDEEDSVIVETILLGIQDPSTLPKPDAKADASNAAPGLASIIHAAGTGDVAALEQIGIMASQMDKAGGDLGMVAGCIRPMVNGERDLDKLCEKISPNAQSLVQAIISELAKLSPQ